MAQEQGRTEEPNFTTPVKYTPPGDCSEMGANPKLPHGLTVQELKEMTKARLQAEAAETPDFREAPIPVPHPHHPNHVPAQGPPPNANVMASASGPPNPIPSGGLLRSIAPPNIPPNAGPPPGYGPPSHFVEMPQHQVVVDPLDNASVSTAASDYPDSVYSLNGSREEAIPFARSASYPNNHSSGDNSLPGESPFSCYEAPNRRRAATLSPRPTLNYSDWRRPIAPTRTRSALAAPQQLQFVGDNRTRTNSAVSLPTFSNTDEEFGGNRFGSTTIRSVREDAPWVSDVFRGGGGSSGVTDSSLQSRPSSELALLHADNSFVQEATTTSVRTWGEPFFCGQDISEDLASILKLSGAEEK